MSSESLTNFSVRREYLLQQMQQQRQIIIDQFSVAETAHNNAYPRSMTMRFLLQQPALAAGMLGGLARITAGTGLFRSMAIAMTVLRLLRSVSVPNSAVSGQRNIQHKVEAASV